MASFLHVDPLGLTGGGNLAKLTSDLESMGFKKFDIDEAVAKVGGIQRVNERPLPETTQAVLDAVLDKQQQQQ
eukprot:scaffold208895_cov13-Tisochrysis_lutea.AAC.1